MWAWTSILAIAALTAAAPREMRVEDKGNFYVRADTPVILGNDIASEVAPLLEPLAAALSGTPQVMMADDVRRPDGIYIGTVDKPGGLDKRRLRRYLDGVETLGDEGYRLVVEKNGVLLAGGGIRGVWHGLHTLAELLERHGANLPYLDIRDWPALAVRGVYLETRPTDADLRTYAALKCTHVFLKSDDFYDLDGVRATAWRRVFEVARENLLEPVPVFSTLSGMDNFLRDNPMLIEGRAVSEAITLRGVDWVPLRYPNILAERPEDVAVAINGVPCTLGRDYWLEPAPLAAPFLPERPRWRIRRELEGAIPNGAQVAVRYNFATEDSGTLCFGAPESRAWLASALERLIQELKPRIIHLDHGSIGRLNQDSRSRALELDESEFFLYTLEQLASTIHAIDPEIKLLMWSDLINPFQAASIYGLESAAEKIPASVTPMGRARIQTPEEALARFDQLHGTSPAPSITMLQAPAGVAGVYQQQMTDGETSAGGLVVPAAEMEAVAARLAVAWGGLGDSSIWTRRLNRYFNTALVQPDFAATRAALVHYLNEATLRGEDPAEVNRRFQAYCGQHMDIFRQDEAAYLLVRSMLDLMTAYLSLEARYSAGPDAGPLRELRSLVTKWQAIEPGADAERYGRILETIETQQLFVPASILLQEELRYYRPDDPPHAQFEVPVRPVFSDSTGESSATFHLMPGQVAVRRIDFESVALNEILLEGRSGDGPFDVVQRWAGEAPAGVRGPLLLPVPAAHDVVRLTATSNAPQAVLRELHLFGAKPSTVLECGYAVQAPPLKATFEGRPWASATRAGAFLKTDTPEYAAAPTAVRATRTRESLYIGIEASEPQPDRIVADLAGHDAPLWRQESVEIWLQPEGALPLRLIVSPLGVRYDSEANDTGWDGEWEAVAEKTATGWNALLRLPIALLGDVQRGTSVPFNVVRNRHSVEQEQSAWAHRYSAQPDLQWGELQFP